MNFIKENIFRKLLLLDLLEDHTSVRHQVLTNYSDFKFLLVGPERCGKTSLLFEYAFQFAELNHNVLFITNKRFETLPHFINTRKQPTTMCLKYIEILYLESAEHFLCAMADIHSKTKNYELIIVDGIDKYCIQHSKETLANTAKICAFLCDAVAYLRSSGGGDTMLLCSITLNINKPSDSGLRKIIEFWIPNLLHYYPHHRGSGFVIKSQTSISNLQNSEDIDVKGVHSEFRDGKILLS